MLVALAAQRWYEARSERGLERQYLTGLRATIANDIDQINRTQLLLEAEKWPAIEYLHNVIAANDQPEPARLVAALDSSASLGWMMPPRVTSVYQELLTTGRLLLLRDAELRSALAVYYGHAAQLRDHIYARRTDYPRTIASLVPAEARARVRERQSLATEVVQQLISRVRQPSFHELLNAEEYYAHFIMQSLQEEEDRAELLLQRIESALGGH